MKNIKYLLLLLIALSFSACEKVIDVELNNAPPRLVIDAFIKWTKGTTGNEQKIKLSTTAPYFNNTIPTVSGATVFITDSNNTVFNFNENAGTGDYLCSDFTPVLNGNYTLTVIYNGQTYTASETLNPAPEITKIEQKNDSGFSGKDIEIKAYFNDNQSTDDFYLFKYKAPFTAIPEYRLLKDDIFQGNEFFGLYTNKDLKTGDEVEIGIYGISEPYFNFMKILMSIAGSNSGSPFQSPPATVRGNIINTTNEANYALGYFSLSEASEKKYIVE